MCLFCMSHVQCCGSLCMHYVHFHACVMRRFRMCYVHALVHLMCSLQPGTSSLCSGQASLRLVRLCLCTIQRPPRGVGPMKGPCRGPKETLGAGGGPRAPPWMLDGKCIVFSHNFTYVVHLPLTTIFVRAAWQAGGRPGGRAGRWAVGWAAGHVAGRAAAQPGGWPGAWPCGGRKTIFSLLKDFLLRS